MKSELTVVAITTVAGRRSQVAGPCHQPPAACRLLPTAAPNLDVECR